ncbi:hypothetical protein [Pseudomonas fluorescens]|uniref:hypothetical protein n=1 Tax=Pseudomonas TaxID=286 RepID=UPI003CFF3C88
MKKAVAALVMTALASTAFAADEIFVPRLTILPFTFKNKGEAGEVTGGVISDWVVLGQTKGNLNTAHHEIVGQLQKRKCGVNFTVAHNGTGRIIPRDGVVSITCPQADESLEVTEVRAYVVDGDGNIGLKTNEYGNNAFITVEEDLHL